MTWFVLLLVGLVTLGAAVAECARRWAERGYRD